MPKKRAPKAKPKAKPKKRAQHGGARAGAGRKRDRLPVAVVARLGVVPTEAVALDLWVRRVLAELLTLQMAGEVSTELAASIRATCGEIRRNLPDAPPPGDEDEEDNDEDEGPELTEVPSDGFIRVG